MTIYFAYGSNMDEEQMKSRCPESKYIGIGFLQNHKIVFNRYSSKRDSFVADIIVAGDDNTDWGVLYELNDKDLKSLDKNEGHPRHYIRKRMIINQIKNIKYSDYDNILISKEYTPVEAEVYEVVNKGNSKSPNLNYLKCILDGAFEHNLPLKYQKMLHEFGTEDYNRRLIQTIDKILDYERIIKNGKFPDKIKNQEEWGGANLVITGLSSRKEQLASEYPHDLVILTPHWRQLSWLVNTLYSDPIIAWQVNATNKHFILHSFGEAALEYQNDNPNDSNPSGICLSVLYSAYKIFTTNFYMNY